MKKELREQVRNKCGGNCGYCGSPLQSDWQVDHMTPRTHYIWIQTSTTTKVDDIENLMPACRKCNHYKRAQPVDSSGNWVGFRDYMLTFHKRLGKLPKRTEVARTVKRIEYMQDIANRYNITPDKPFTGIFYFETLNNK